MEAFNHDPIDLDRPAFRLLQLLHGQGSAIKCILYQAFLDGDDTIPYEALSYTWGGNEKPCKVEVNTRLLEVTENLYLALQHLRSPTEDRIIWIDAICIDQKNVKERGHQVQHMSKIYSQAEEVIVWLGHGTQETDEVMDTLVKLEKHSLIHARKDWDLGQWNNFCALDTQRRSSSLQTGLSLLWDRPWWRRVWILQEVANAKKASIHCGSRSVKSRTFSLASKLIDAKPTSGSQRCQAVLDIMPGPLRAESWWSHNRTLRHMLLKFGQSEATDQRDNIYALLGMSSDAYNTEHLRPDYTRSIDEVVYQTSVFLFGLPNALHGTYHELLTLIATRNATAFIEAATVSNATEVGYFMKAYELNLTEKIVISATANRNCGAHIIFDLVHVHGYTIKVTEAMCIAAAASEVCGWAVMKVFCDLQWADNRISEAMLFAAADNQSTGLQILRLLVATGKGLHVTQQVVLAAASNRHGRDMMDLLIQHASRGITASEDVLLAALGNKDCGMSIIGRILQWCGSMVVVTDSMWEVAQHEEESKLILDLILTFQAASRANDHGVTLQLLLDHGANPYAHGEEYGSLLWNAAWMGDVQVVRNVLKRCAETMTRGDYVKTHLIHSEPGLPTVEEFDQRLRNNALSVACFRDQEQAVRVLLQNGADPNADYHVINYPRLSHSNLPSAKRHSSEQVPISGNALHQASYRGCLDIVQTILEESANSMRPARVLTSRTDAMIWASWNLDNRDLFWGCHICMPHFGSVHWGGACRGCKHVRCQKCPYLSRNESGTQYCYRNEDDVDVEATQLNQNGLKIYGLLRGYMNAKINRNLEESVNESLDRA